MHEFDRFKHHAGNTLGLIREYGGFFDEAARRFAHRRTGTRVLGYVGWTGYRNLGDEAMFEAVRRLLPEFHLKRFAGSARESVLARLGVGGSSIFSAVVLGGGTLINPLYLGEMRVAARLGMPLYTFGTGVGSCGFAAPWKVSLQGWNAVLKSCSRVAVRGPLSRDALHANGFSSVRVIGDPALSLSPDTPPEQRTKRRLVINLAQDGNHDYAEGDFGIFRRIEKIAKQFAMDGGDVVGVALGSGDLTVLRRFRDHAGLPGMRIERHPQSHDAFFQTVRGSVALIGVRLHSAVLASCVGVPSVLVSYRSKCDDFMQSMNMPELAVPLSADSGNVLEERWSRIVEDPEAGQKAWRMAQHWKQRQIAYAGELMAELRGGLAN